MLSLLTSLFLWLPSPLYELCIGVVVLFFAVIVFRAVKFVLDLIPFL